ncbi:nuclease-related domain-containing protein [Cellulomonas terrae]|uniref:nuclease-related domain-containing protein n=1 Tax=Cellulomonas terrae TaxID=311234 RepID=UPI0011BF9AEB
MGEAGFGAEEQASRRARRVAQLRAEEARSCELDAEVQARLVRAQRDQRAWSAGAEGERLVAAAIESTARYGWAVLHDLHWPGRPKANLDHVALGPGGVILVDAKNWSGDVTIVDGRLRQNGYDRTPQVESVASAAADLSAELAPPHRSAVRGIVCLASQDLPPTSSSLGVVVVGRVHLPAYLASLPYRLSPFDVADVGRYLESHLGGATSPGVPTPRKRRPSSRTVQKRREGAVQRPTTRSRGSSKARQSSCASALGRLFIVGVGLVVLLNVLSNVSGR